MYLTSYERMGGAKKVLALVNRFCGLMDEQAEHQEIRLLHPYDLIHTREKLHPFLCGLLGGSSLYQEKTVICVSVPFTCPSLSESESITNG